MLISIVLGCFLVYNTYTRIRMSGDTIPGGFLPFSIVYYHDLFLEHFYNPDFAANAYAFADVNGHLMSIFPIVTPVLVTPFVFVCTLSMNPTQAFFHTTQIARTASAGIAALSVGIFYLVAIRFVPKKIAAVSALVFAFATATWSIGSQALWQHGMVGLLILLILYALLRHGEEPSPAWIGAAGLFSGLLLFCRPPDAWLLLPVIGYVLLRNRKYLAAYLVPAVLAGLPFLAYNWIFFGSVFGGYVQNLGRFGISPEVPANFAGLLLSPNKGLFVFSPVLVLAVFGYFRLGTLMNKDLALLLRWFGPVLLLETAMYAFFSDWGGGFAYGPRFLASMVPVLGIYVAVFLADAASRFRAGTYGSLKAGVIAALILVSVIIQGIGVFCFPYLEDARYPHPWDAGNTVILGSLQEGVARFDTFAVQSVPPLPPLYYYTRYDEWKYLDMKAALSAGDYETAMTYYAQHLRENPDSYILWNNLGCCLMKLGNYREALDSFDRALAINPQFREAGSNRATALQILASYNGTAAAGTTEIFGKTGAA